MSLKRFFTSQPRRCAGGEAGVAGHCLACGAHPAQLCQAAPEHRYKPHTNRKTRK